MAGNFFGITDKGRMRDNNEDTFIAQTILNNRYILACVIDGVGGYEGGEVASAIANETITDYLKNELNEEPITALKNSVINANKKIYERKLTDAATSEMACVLTLALADVEENKFYYAHVGDTRLYLLRDASLVKVTNDHSFVGFLEDSGRLTEDAAMRHPKRNEISKALGFDEHIFLQADYIETGESPFLPNDILLLCSDGLSDMINNKLITSILTSEKSLKQKGKALIDAANNAGGRDNITVVLVENDKSPQTHEATKPVVLPKKNETKEEVEEVINATEKKEIVPEKKVIVTKKSSSGFLIFLCIILLVAVGWSVYKDFLKDKFKQQPKAVMPAPEKKRSIDEIRLVNSIETTKEIFINKIFNANQPIIFNDEVFVDKQDTIIIHGNNTIIAAAPPLKIAAFVFSPNCKYILIDSLTLDHFKVGIITQNATLHLRHVQFKNCGVAVQHDILSVDKNVSGKIDDSLSVSKKDSAKAKH